MAADHEVMVRAFQAVLGRCTKPYLGAVMLNPLDGMVGALVLGTKIGITDFDEEDELIASAVTAQAGVAYQSLASAAGPGECGRTSGRDRASPHGRV